MKRKQWTLSSSFWGENKASAGQFVSAALTVMKCLMGNCQQLGETRDLETPWRHSTHTHTHIHIQPIYMQTHPLGDAGTITTHRQLLQRTHGRGSETSRPCVDRPVMWLLKH